MRDEEEEEEGEGERVITGGPRYARVFRVDRVWGRGGEGRRRRRVDIAAVGGAGDVTAD